MQTQLQTQFQTQTVQSPNKAQAPKSAPLPNNDFKQALALEIDRAPISVTPEQPAPAKAPVKQAQPAKPAQPAQKTQSAQQASGGDEAQAPAETAEAAPADSKPAATPSSPSGEADEGDDATAAAADPAASMLAMLAAYNQLTAKAEPVASAAAAGADTLAAQAEGAGKVSLADLAATARDTGTTALQDALSEQAGAERMLKAGMDTGLGAGQETEAFDAKLAANLAAAQAASVSDNAPAAQPVAVPAAQALAATMQAANAVAANQLQARVGSNAWEQQLGQKVVWMVAGGDQSASLTLNPPDLGPLQVVLNVSNDSATATFTAHQPETRQAIENALPKLREMMSEAGIALGDATVSAGSQEQQQAFAESARRGGGGGRQGNGGAGAGQEEAQPVIRRAVLGAVDTFA